MSFSVNFWGSKPRTNDDCYNTSDFETFVLAVACFKAPVVDTSIAYVELDGPDVHRERRNPDYVDTPIDEDEWTREIEREHLMLHGSLDK